MNFLSALIENAVERGLADPTRVYLIGHSNGGGMAMRMACDRPDLVAGIGVVATKVLEAYPCTGGAPVPAIFFHGTDDRIAPHEGREGGRLGDTYSSVDSLAIWAERNGCARPGEVQHVDARPGDGTSLEIVNYRGCDAPLTYVVIEGGGHGWPGAARGGPLSGRITREINAAAPASGRFCDNDWPTLG